MLFTVSFLLAEINKQKKNRSGHLVILISIGESVLVVGLQFREATLSYGLEFYEFIYRELRQYSGYVRVLPDHNMESM